MTRAKKASAKRVSRGGRPPADQAESRKAALLDAATEVFMEVGFSGANMTTIAKRAGASKETLYARYPNKLQLFAALLERKSSSLREVIASLDPEREPREALTSYGIELVSMMTMADTQKLHRIVIAGSIDSPELGTNLWEAGPGRGFKIVRTYLHEQKKRGTLKIGDPDRAARMLMGMFVGEIVLRTTLGVETTIQTREAQLAWTTYVVDNFLKTFA